MKFQYTLNQLHKIKKYRTGGNRGAPDNNKPELIYYIVDWWFLHPNYEFKPKELERSKYPRIEEFIY